MFNKNRTPTKLFHKHLIRLIQIRNDPEAAGRLRIIQSSNLDIIRQTADPFHNFPFQISAADVFLPSPYLEAKIKRFPIALLSSKAMKPKHVHPACISFHLLRLYRNLYTPRQRVKHFVSI